MNRPDPEEVAEILNADVAVLFEHQCAWWLLLVVRPKNAAEGNKPAFAGGRKEPEDNGEIRKTATRELRQELGIESTEEELVLVEVLDGRGVDPRPGARTSIVFAKVVSREVARTAVSPEGLELIRVPLAHIKPGHLAFSHDKAIPALRQRYPDHD